MKKLIAINLFAIAFLFSSLAFGATGTTIKCNQGTNLCAVIAGLSVVGSKKAVVSSNLKGLDEADIQKAIAELSANVKNKALSKAGQRVQLLSGKYVATVTAVDNNSNDTIIDVRKLLE